MKKIILLGMLFTCFNSMAQFNRTYNATIGGNAVEDGAKDIISIGGGHSVILSAYNGSFTLKEIDDAGAVVFHTTYTAGMYTSACQLIQAQNGDYIVVGYAVGSVTNPFAARFSPGGTFNWFQEYQSNTSTLSFLSFEMDVNVIYAGDDPSKDEYILAATGDGFGTPNPGNYSVNAVRFDGATGATVWNKKYQPDHTGAPDPQPYHIFTAALTYNGEIENAEYFIAGSVVSYPGPQDGFNLGINGAGMPTGFFVEFEIPGYGFGYDAIFDGNTGKYVMTYTCGNTNVSGSNAVSTIAVTKFNPWSRNIWSSDLYWEDDPSANHTENYGFGIIEDMPGNNYIIAAYNFKDKPFAQVSTSVLLKIDKSGIVQDFKRYNIATGSMPSAITNIIDGFSNELYVIPETALDLSSMWNVRVLGINTSGETCGWENMNSQAMTYSHNEIFYVPLTGTITSPDIPGFLSTDGGQTSYDCDPIFPEYKPGTTGVHEMATRDLKVYPNPATDQLTIEQAMGSDYQVVNALGQVVAKGFIEQAKQSIALNTLAQGVYVIILTNNGDVQQMKFVKE